VPRSTDARTASGADLAMAYHPEFPDVKPGALTYMCGTCVIRRTSGSTPLLPYLPGDETSGPARRTDAGTYAHIGVTDYWRGGATRCNRAQARPKLRPAGRAVSNGWTGSCDSG